MESTPPKPEGLRERKRRETRELIAKTGMKLIIAQGYESTTLEAIALAAGISRRTFFYYFKSKDEILSTFQRGLSDRLLAALRQEPPGQEPIDAVRHAILKLAGRHHQSREAIAIDRVVSSTDSLLARTQAGFIQQERALFDTLCELWPEPERRTGLRIVAMTAIGIMRLAIEIRGAECGEREMTAVLQNLFAALKAEI